MPRHEKTPELPEELWDDAKAAAGVSDAHLIPGGTRAIKVSEQVFHDFPSEIKALRAELKSVEAMKDAAIASWSGAMQGQQKLKTELKEAQSELVGEKARVDYLTEFINPIIRDVVIRMIELERRQGYK